MMSWSFTETVETTARAEQIWMIWSNPANWPTWDTDIEWVKQEGNFVQGTTGIMKPRGGPKVKFLLQEVQINRSFMARSFLPLTTLDIIHTYIPAIKPDEKAKISHQVKIRGILTPLFRRVIGNKIKKGLPESMRKLVALAEKV